MRPLPLASSLLRRRNSCPACLSCNPRWVPEGNRIDSQQIDGEWQAPADGHIHASRSPKPELT